MVLPLTCCIIYYFIPCYFKFTIYNYIVNASSWTDVGLKQHSIWYNSKIDSNVMSIQVKRLVIQWLALLLLHFKPELLIKICMPSLERARCSAGRFVAVFILYHKLK